MSTGIEFRDLVEVRRRARYAYLDAVRQTKDARRMRTEGRVMRATRERQRQHPRSRSTSR